MIFNMVGGGTPNGIKEITMPVIASGAASVSVNIGITESQFRSLVSEPLNGQQNSQGCFNYYFGCNAKYADHHYRYNECMLYCILSTFADNQSTVNGYMSAITFDGTIMTLKKPEWSDLSTLSKKKIIINYIQ